MTIHQSPCHYKVWMHEIDHFTHLGDQWLIANFIAKGDAVAYAIWRKQQTNKAHTVTERGKRVYPGS